MKLGTTSFFALIVAVLVAFTAYDYWSSQKKDAVKEADAKVVTVSRDTISSIEIAGPKETLRLEKREGHWNIAKPFSESADQQAVLSYLDQLIGERISQVVKEGDLDLKSYGLSPPQFTMTLLGDPKSAETVKVGSVRAYDGSLYGQIDDQKKVVLLSSSWDVLMTKPAKDFRDTKLYHGPVKIDFDKIIARGADKDTAMNFEIDRTENKYELKNSPDPLHQPSVQAWLEQIKALRGVAFVDDPKPGFKPDITITLLRKDTEPYVLQIARNRDHPDQYEIASSDLPGQMKSRVIAGKSAMNSVIVKTEVFYSKKAPFEFDPKEVAELKFHDAKSGKNFETKIDPTHPDVLLSKIAALEAVRFLGPSVMSGEKKFSSHLSLLKSDGSVVFEMSWGTVVTEPETLEKPEARYLPVKTNLVKQVVGVPEKLIAALGAQPEPGADSSPEPLPGSNAKSKTVKDHR